MNTTTTTTPRTPRLVAAAATIALVTAVLAGCSLIPSLPGGGSDGGSAESNSDSASSSELAGTTWSGVDSDGDSWGLELQEDGTVGLTYGGNSFDDTTDIWAQAGDTVTIHVEFDDGPIDIVGQYAGLDAPLETTGTWSDGTFTLTLTRE
jgi:hypothetical protein